MKPNFNFNKRKREEAKKKKREEKIAKRLAQKNGTEPLADVISAPETPADTPINETTP